MEVMSADNIKKIVVMMARCGTVAGKVLADGSINFLDIVYLPEASSVIASVKDIDFTKVVPEAMQIPEAEIEGILATFKAEFKFPNPAIEISIETVLSAVVKVVELGKKLYEVIMELIGSFKPAIA